MDALNRLELVGAAFGIVMIGYAFLSAMIGESKNDGYDT